MRDDWNDLIEFVTQNLSQNLLSGGEGRDEQVPDNDNEEVPTIIATPATPAFGFESLKRQLVNTGSFSFILKVLINSVKKILKCVFVISGFQKQLDWIQSSLLTSCSVRLDGAYADQELRNPMACLQMSVSDSIVPGAAVKFECHDLSLSYNKI